MLKRRWNQRFVSFIKTDDKASHRFAYGAACPRSDTEKVGEGSRVGDSNAGNIETLRPALRTTVLKFEKHILYCSTRCFVFPQDGSTILVIFNEPDQFL